MTVAATGGAVIRTDALDPTTRGRAYGETVAERLARVEVAYLKLFLVCRGHDEATILRLGEATLGGIARWRPQVAEELVGVAEGSGRRPEFVAALNARTEILAGSPWMLGECTTIARAAGQPGDTPWLAQNWDWTLDVPDRCVIWDAAVPEGRYLSFTEAGMLAKIGLNDRGIAVGLNVLAHRADGGPVGTPIHIILRELLAKCSAIADVEEILAEARPSASSCVTVVCRDSPGASFEITPAGVGRLDPGQGGGLYHTNHLLDPTLALAEASAARADSAARLATVNRACPRTAPEAEALLASHQGTPPAPCRHREPQSDGLPDFGTVAAVTLLPDLGRLAWTGGPPCSSGWSQYTLRYGVTTTSTSETARSVLET